jgi:hypothetical protein
MKNVKNLRELVHECKIVDNHFFDAGSMRFFNSEIEDCFIKKDDYVIIVTSERMEYYHAKKYTIRIFKRLDNGKISIYSYPKFHHFEWLNTAIKTAENLTIEEIKDFIEND